MMLKRAILATAVAVSLTTQAHAGSEIETLINMLHENGMVSDEQYGRLMVELKQNQVQVAEEKAGVDRKLAEAAKPSDVEVALNGGLSLRTRDGKFSTKLGGRLQADAAAYGGDPEMGDGSEIRRAWLRLNGTMFQDWGYLFQYGFEDNSFKAAYVAYNGFDNVQIKAGKMKEPFSLQEQTPDTYVMFNELALPAAFSAGRRVGVMASTAKQHWSLAAGLFGNSSATKVKGEDEGWGGGLRTTWAPINDRTAVLHFGLNLNHRDTGDSGTTSFKQQPETHIAGINIVDTGTINAVKNFYKIGAEFATVKGPFSAQAEYIGTGVNRNSGPDLDFDGWYVQSSYFLTGESRNYNKGKFGVITPKANVGEGGIGAWELALRYSTLDLIDADIDGGEADAVTLGLNWYPTPTLKFSANYVDVLEVDGGSFDDEEPKLFQVRSQWAF